MKPLYTADVKVIGGREGSVESTDGVLNHKLSMPKELGGPGGDGTNPERCLRPAMAPVTKAPWLISPVKRASSSKTS